MCMISYLEKFSLKGKTAFITGGVGLIGAEISKALASAHAKTIIIDIDENSGMKLSEKLINMGYNAFFENIDITDLNNIDRNIDQLFEKYNGIDIWINSAYPRTEDWGNKVEDLCLDSWRENVDMHMNSYSWISRKVCLLMKGKGGSLINIGSTYGVLGNDFTVYEDTDMTSPMAYSAIKGGIINLTRYLASYFGGYNIRVNSLCPGGVYNNQNSTFVKAYSKKTPLKRMGNPEELASAALFLASDAASYISGATIMVDGGWSAI